jgi:tRNA-2-methylthio-N6-dimethylallyladenosine synthase
MEQAADLPGWHGAIGPAVESATNGRGSHRHDHDDADFVPLSVIHDNNNIGSPQPLVTLETPATGVRQLTGRTSCDRIVVFDGNPRLAGSVADVEIDDCTATTLVGRIVTREIQHDCDNLLPILV